ncbi:MAG: hypothetical protein ACM3H7_00860 [Acidobacteriaceae bacterium]
MKRARPLVDATTHYRVWVQGRVDVEWLQSYESTAKVLVDETGPQEGISVLSIHTDQSGIVGLVRRLHGSGMTILQLQVVTGNMRSGDVE